MNREEVFQFAREKYGTEPDYPWNDQNAVLRHKENNKWYAVIMKVAENKLGLLGDHEIDIVNVKCDPVLIGALRTRLGFYPAYHMNKDKWISIRLQNGDRKDFSSDEEIKSLIDLSYELTGTRKQRKGNR